MPVNSCLLVAVVLVLHVGVNGQTMPSGCSYNKGLYECSYTTLNSNSKIPLSASEFSNPVCQRLKLTDMPTSITSAIFNSNFNSISTASYDTNFPAYLELKCANNGALNIASAGLTYTSYIRDFKISNCQVTAQANAFGNLQNLDRFTIENGTIASMAADALSAVLIAKTSRSTSPTFPVKNGELVFKNAKVTGGTLPATLFSQQTKLVSVTLEGLGLTSLDSSMFSVSTGLRYLSLGYNSFTEVPTGLLDNITALAELRLYDTTLDCTCEKLWFYALEKSSGLKIYGDVLCVTPTAYENKKAAVYYYANCITIPATCDGLFTLMGACIQWIELTLYIICVIAFILGIVVLILTIHTKRQLGGGAGGGSKGKGGKGGKKKPVPMKKKPPPKGAKKGWA